MKITRQFKNGKWEPPFTPDELAAKERAFALMCETRQAPIMVGSERAFLADVGFRHHGLEDHPVWLQHQIVSQAKRAGIAVDGKRYFGGLADHRGPADPGAWCATQQDYLDTVKRRNLNAVSGCGIGGVNHQGVLAPPPPDVDLAPDIVNRLAKEYVAKDPDLARKPAQEVKEMVIDKHGARKSKSVKPFKVQPNFRDLETD